MKSEVAIIVEHIESCMKQYVRNFVNKEDMHSRLDELFLLWSNLTNQSFVASVKDFGLVYEDFTDRKYEKIYNQVYKLFIEDLKHWEDTEQEESTISTGVEK